ncbi:hypothetical protein, partial [Stenotrophomonas maltophilia]|uniref:hypothetical protein n=1 Tax=Stenotrophomonas maltophilia TaxID=40324 RepID=UPI001F554229
NVVARVDAKEHVYPRKEKMESKIDGAVALIMAMGRAMQARDTGTTHQGFVVIDGCSDYSRRTGGPMPATVSSRRSATWSTAR